ncbi:hypothetical protein CSW47_08295 [Thermus scotoductus]|uniref:Uncharacterized protein n=1 Tax=Thermus scotoductus TaxID=37636 RepID=A0A430R8Q7_THESC|nr:hypothetical protein [Thermus scotoductus]RTH03683.1 hypothetical protein CSW47_08295 [Thermus scotoductus]
MRLLALLPFLSLTLAQVGLLDGPRPSTEVRGYLEGNAQEGYRVRVEFYLETGTNPTQGTSYQSLTWNGRLYLCVGGCDTFSLQGFAPGTYPNGQVYDLYDSQNRLRGKAGVTTEYDAYNKPYRYRVEYAVWPLQGTKTWQASPDNPVPMETGGWLTARPPGGNPERYRYPGMESYRPPSGGSIFAGISPQDRDLAQKSLIDSMAKLRAFYGRQVRGSELWFFVPEVSPWTFQLAQEYQARVGGGVRFVVPEGTAQSYCPTGYRNDTRFHVLPRPSLDKQNSLAVIWPPQNASQKGAAMAGRYLVDRPDWPDGPDCLSQTVALVPTTSDLPEARAYLYGCISQANLKARVEFKEMTLGEPYLVWRRQGWSWSYIYSYRKDWDGKATFDLGGGDEEVRITLPSSAPTDWTRVEPVKDAKGRDRGYAYVKATVERTLDTRNTISLTYKDQRTAPWDFSFQHGGETFTLWWTDPWRQLNRCGRSSNPFYSPSYPLTCEVRDGQNRVRGSATVNMRMVWEWQWIATIRVPYYDYAITLPAWKESVTGWQAYWYLSRWQTTWRAATDNDRPVEAGGYVTAEGKRYRIPGLEGYLMPQGREIEAVEGDPYVTYITRSLLPDRNPYGGLNREEAKTWYKPLSQWCRERGL